MRFITVGLGSDGRSRVIEEREITHHSTLATGVFKSNTLWSTSEQPPEVPCARRKVDGAWVDVECVPGGTRWFTVAFGPEHKVNMHHTSTIDYDVIIAGQVTLGLEVGEIVLHPGDCVLIPGCMHSWSAGPDGCSFSATVLALAPVT